MTLLYNRPEMQWCSLGLHVNNLRHTAILLSTWPTEIVL